MAKKTLSLRNPFLYQGYVSPEYFCDRTQETEDLISNLQNGRNTVLISPRRIGKTGLIKNAFYHIKEQEKDAKCLYVDIFATKNQHEFVQLLGTSIAQEVLSKERKAINSLLKFFSSWRPVFSTDPLTGAPSVSISIEPTLTEINLKTVFEYLNKSKHQVYIAIDEFQQITSYPETGTEALLRSYIQFAPNVHFVFSGSKRHLMSQIFFSPDRPFYQSTVSMGLEPLHEEIYYDFARRFFEKRNGSFSQEVFSYIYNTLSGVTRNIQLVLNRLYETEKKVDKQEYAEEAIRYIVNRNSMQYEEFFRFLTDNQVSVVKAIAQEGVVESPQSNEFIRRHNLPSSSSVKTAIDALIDKEILYNTKKGYVVYDHFFALWLKSL